jgi:hypothetical protein
MLLFVPLLEFNPNDQRIDPHILTVVRNAMIRANQIRKLMYDNVPWFCLPETPESFLEQRLYPQRQTLRELNRGDLSHRIGQTLEIATYRALLQLQTGTFLGRFKDLDSHDDGSLYSKEEPPQHLGAYELEGQERLDFLVHHPETWLGIECKNIREWLYPDRPEVKEAIAKCVALDCIPVIIARRIPFVTFRLLSTCGVIFHETFNQLYPLSAQQIAERARHKDNLGYHDIRLGNTPDARLLKFITKDLFNVIDSALFSFNEYKDVLDQYVSESMGYDEFAARVRRRREGRHEDSDWSDAL